MAYFFSNSKTYAVIVLYRDNVDISVRKRTVLSPIFLACFPNLQVRDVTLRGIVHQLSRVLPSPHTVFWSRVCAVLACNAKCTTTQSGAVVVRHAMTILLIISYLSTSNSGSTCGYIRVLPGLPADNCVQKSYIRRLCSIYQCQLKYLSILHENSRFMQV